MHSREYGLKLRSDYSTLEGEALDVIIKETIGHNYLIGPNSVQARLFSQGIKMQRWKVRESMLRVCPDGFAIRAALATRRRTYTVAGPNSLWHMDGNHKLIRLTLLCPVNDT